MRIARLALAGALLFGAAACQTDDGGAVNANIPPLAFVRYINAVPDTFNLTVRWVDQIDFTPMTFVNVPFRGLGQGGYQGLEAGSRHFRVFTYDPALAGTVGGLGAQTAQMADTTFNFVAGQYYTILHLGYARTGSTPAQRVYILSDALPAANTTQTQVRFIHANPAVGALDVFTSTAANTALTGLTPVFTNVAFNTTTAYAVRDTSALNAAAQVAATGTTVSLAGALGPAGVAGTPAADPIAGTRIPNSVLTAIFYPATPAAPASPGATFATAGVVWYSDRQPPRTTTP